MFNFLKNRIVQALIAIGFIGVAAAQVVGPTETQTPPSITVAGETIEFTWTDDNTDEDLILYTDQQTYKNGLSHAEVYVAVQNTSNQAQDVSLMAYFRDSKKQVAKVQQFGIEEYEYDVTEEREVCTETATSTGEETCGMQNVVIGTETATRTVWADVATVGRTPAEVQKEGNLVAANPAARKAVEGFVAPKKTVGTPVAAGDTAYFKVLVTYPPNSGDNFYLEAIGSEGGYGHLDPWFDASWDYRVKVTVDNTKVSGSGSHTNYPAYVDLSDLPADFHNNVKTDGCDIRVVESDETTETPFELVEYDSANDTGELHFLVDSLSTSADTDFYIYYGNSGASCYAESATYGSNNVWASYHAVWHMQGANSTASKKDNSDGGSGFDIVENGTFSSATTDQFGSSVGAYEFTDSTEFLDNASNQTISTDSTVTMWVNPDAVDATSILLDYYDPTQADRVFATFFADPGKLRFVRYNTSGTLLAAADSADNVLSINSWQHLVYRANSSNAYVYHNASEVASDSHSLTFNTSGSGQPITFGNRQNNTSIGLDGTMGEVRISNTDLNADWITTEYNNQNSPSTFYSVGAQETDGGGGEAEPTAVPRIISHRESSPNPW